MRITILFFSLLIGVGVFAQTRTVVIKPTVMVVPFTKEGEQMRTVLEAADQSHLRVAMSKVKAAFDEEEIKTIDIRAALRQYENTKAIELNQQSSVKQEVISLSGADIYIETEAQIVKTKRGNSVTVILNAYDAFSGHSLANSLGHSPKFYTENYEKLSEKALVTFLDDFVKLAKKAFHETVNNGRSVIVDIGIAESAALDMDSEVGETGDLLSDLIEAWFDENAYQGYFQVQGVTATKMILNEVKIPMRDPVTEKNYRPSAFAAKFRKYLSSLGIEATRDVQGTKLFFTIEG